MVGWSSRASADSATQARTMLRLVLGSGGVRRMRPWQEIFGRTDNQIENAIDKLIPLFARGRAGQPLMPGLARVEALMHGVVGAPPSALPTYVAHGTGVGGVDPAVNLAPGAPAGIVGW